MDFHPWSASADSHSPNAAAMENRKRDAYGGHAMVVAVGSGERAAESPLAEPAWPEYGPLPRIETESMQLVPIGELVSSSQQPADARSTVAMVALDAVEVGTRRRRLDPRRVEELAGSMRPCHHDKSGRNRLRTRDGCSGRQR